MANLAVSRLLPLGHGRWLVAPVLYIIHSEHVHGGPDRFLLGAASVVVVLAVAAVPARPRWMRVAFGLFAGGAAANGLDLLVTGSVTDFVGLRGWGALSAGDLCMLAAAIAVTVSLAARREAHGVSRRVLLVLIGLFIAWAVLSRTRVNVVTAVIVTAPALVVMLASAVRDVARGRVSGRGTSGVASP